MIFSVLSFTLLLMIIVTSGVILATKNPKMACRNEIRIGIIGAVWFTYVSWACIYMAQYRPISYVPRKHEDL